MQNKNIQSTVKREGIRPRWTGTLGMVKKMMDSENQVGFVTKIRFSIFLMNIFSRNFIRFTFLSRIKNIIIYLTLQINLLLKSFKILFLKRPGPFMSLF
jgi:hypothetical protein